MSDPSDFYWSTGSSQSDVYYCIISTLIGYYIWSVFGRSYGPIGQFIVLVMPIIISYCFPSPTFTTLTILTLITYERTIKPDRTAEEDLARPKYITVFRSFLQLLTIIAILAVDFKIFPRKFAKTHDFGFSLVNCYY